MTPHDILVRKRDFKPVQILVGSTLCTPENRPNGKATQTRMGACLLQGVDPVIQKWIASPMIDGGSRMNKKKLISYADESSLEGRRSGRAMSQGVAGHAYILV